MKTADNVGCRVDRVIVAEVLPQLVGKTIKLQCQYSLSNED